MRLYHLTVWVAALLAVVALASGGVASAARRAAAVPESPMATATPTATHTATATATHTATATKTATPTPIPISKVTITAKVTLHETSIAGPSLARTEGIAWTGTDAAHHLNIRRGTDGLHFPTKFVLPETSPVGPALIAAPGPGVGDHIVDLAWTGTDPAHHVNVEFDAPNGAKKLILPETSFAAPAISDGIVNGTEEWLVAWTGTDANHSLNVLPITSSSAGNPVVGKKTVLSQFSSDAGPSLVRSDSGSNSQFEFVLGWSMRGTQLLNLAESTDGVHFINGLGASLPQTSADAPQFLQTGSNSSSGCIAWTGTDSAHHLNVQCTTHFPQFPNPAQTKTVLPETALGAPSLSFFSQVEIAWTGTDAAHHLNVAQLQGT